MNKKKKLYILVIVILLGFVSFFVDEYLISLIPLVRVQPLNTIFQLLETFAVEFLASVLLFLTFGFAFWRKGKTKWIIVLFFSMVVAALLTIGIQNIIARPRPADAMLIEIKIALWEYSFPSGHAAVAFAAVPIFSKVLPKYQKLWIGLGVLVGVSRLYTGAHYLSDVIFGSILGYLVGTGIKNWRYIKADLEVRRQLFHSILGLIFVVLIGQSSIEYLGARPPFNLFYFLPLLSRVFLLILLVGATLVLISRDHKIPIIHWFLNKFERPEVKTDFPGKGSFFFFVGAFLVSLIFRRSIVAASLVILAVGDSVSHVFGAYFGRIKHPLSDVKNIEGNLIGALAGGFGASMFVHPVIAFTSAFLAMFIEGITFDDWKEEINEDNVVIPLISATTIFLMQSLLF